MKFRLLLLATLSVLEENGRAVEALNALAEELWNIAYAACKLKVADRA